MAAKKTTTTKATTKKTTTKSTTKKTTTKKTQTKSKKTEKVDPKMERKQAKTIKLSLAQFRVLKALAKSGDAMTYRDIEKVTGYYSILTQVMRTKHDGSLCSRKLATEEMHDVNGRDVLAFRITAAGKKAVQQAEKVAD